MVLKWRVMSLRYTLLAMTPRQTTIAPPADVRVPAKDAAALLGVSVRTLDRYQAAGRIKPAPVPLAPRMFRLADVHALRGGA